MVHDALPVLRDRREDYFNAYEHLGCQLMTFMNFMVFLMLVWANAGDAPLVEERYDRLAILRHSITRLSSVLFVLQGDQGGPALVGFFAMLPWVLWGWWGTGPGSGESPSPNPS